MKNWLRSFAIALVAALAAFGIVQGFRTASDLEAFLFDIRQIAFAPENPANKDIVMVWLDEQTMQGLPYRTPIPRDFLAGLHKKIAEANPKLIGYDIFFKDPSFPDADRELAVALKSARAYAVVPRRPDGTADMPLETFAKALTGIGLADLPFNPFDTKVRTAQLSFPTDRGKMDSFAALIYRAATGNDALALIEDKKMWPHMGPLTLTPFMGNEGENDSGRRIYIRFAGPPGSVGGRENAFKTYSALLVSKGIVPALWLKDKIVLIGAGYEDLKDAFLTPYYAAFTGYARMNGIEIHANILSELLEKQFYYQPMPWQTWVTIFIISLAIAASAVKWSPWRATSSYIVMLILICVAAVLSFKELAVVLPIVAPVTGATVAFGAGLGWRALTEGRQKRFIKGVFARYVPPAVVERMTEDPKLLVLGGEEKTVTSLFSDIASFTTISERMSPTALVSFLNEYLGRMNEVLFEFGATLDKYEGDAIIAFFNAPLAVAQHELCAARAAIRMKRASTGLTEGWRERCGREIITRIGLNTGPAVVGNMGSEGRFDYTAIGDTINLASRLEGTNKFYGTVVMASESTVEKLDDSIVTRPVDRARVKGKTRPILLYEITEEADRIGSTLLEKLITPYKEAFRLFEGRETGAATELLLKIKSVYPNDGPTLELLKRCEKAKNEPNWDMVTDLTSK